MIRSAKQPELPVILLEDLGAHLGLIVALIGVSLALITGDGLWDAAGTAMTGLLLVAARIAISRSGRSFFEATASSPLAAG